MSRKFVIGSRGSQLALWQANHVADAMRERGLAVDITIIKTLGDRMQDANFRTAGATAPPGVDGKGIFTREIEEALADGRIDLAVHSLKDLPVVLVQGFTLAAIPMRADARDVLVSAKYASLDDLPRGAMVGTTSLRRQSQLLGERGDLKFTALRGNVDTRLRKMSEGAADALVLAAAGLVRLGLTQQVREQFDAHVVCPAPGQGALGIETRVDDAETIAALKFMDDAETRFAVTAERMVLENLGGGCSTPIGAHYAENILHAAVAAPDGKTILRAEVPRNAGESAKAMAAEITKKLVDVGAKTILGI